MVPTSSERREDVVASGPGAGVVHQEVMDSKAGHGAELDDLDVAEVEAATADEVHAFDEDPASRDTRALSETRFDQDPELGR